MSEGPFFPPLFFLCPSLCLLENVYFVWNSVSEKVFSAPFSMVHFSHTNNELHGKCLCRLVGIDPALSAKRSTNWHLIAGLLSFWGDKLVICCSRIQLLSVALWTHLWRQKKIKLLTVQTRDSAWNDDHCKAQSANCPLWWWAACHRLGDLNL